MGLDPVASSSNESSRAGSVEREYVRPTSVTDNQDEDRDNEDIHSDEDVDCREDDEKVEDHKQDIPSEVDSAEDTNEDDDTNQGDTIEDQQPWYEGHTFFCSKCSFSTHSEEFIKSHMASLHQIKGQIF